MVDDNIRREHLLDWCPQSEDRHNNLIVKTNLNKRNEHLTVFMS